MALVRQPVTTLTPQSVDRDRQLAQLLLGQAQQRPVQGVGTLVGNLAQVLAGQRRFERASAGEEQLRQQQRDQLANVLGGLPGGGGTVGGVSLADVLSSPNPALQSVGGAILQSQLQPGTEAFEPITDDAGNILAQRNIRTGQVIADPRAPDLRTPEELAQELEISRARAIQLNLGTQTEIGKLVSDRSALLGQGVPEDAPAVQAIDRRIEEIGAVQSDEALKANEAGRIAMIEGGANALNTVIGTLFPEGLQGAADNRAVADMIANISEGGRLANSNLRDVISVILRLETGAQANAQEIDEAFRRFAPSILDLGDDIVIRDKLTRLQQRLNRALELTQVREAGDLTADEQTELDALRRAQGVL